MMKQHTETYTSLLHRELKIAMGCTEPAAAALAGALARDLLGLYPESVEIWASRDIIKNVMGVGIPNSSLTGTDTAVLLGILAGDPLKGLNILSTISKETDNELKAFKKAHLVTLKLQKDVPAIYIAVLLKAKSESASVTIAGEHDRVVKKVKNNQVLFEDTFSLNEEKNTNRYPKNWSIQDILNYVTSLKEKEGEFLLELAEINIAIGDHSLTTSYGLEVGKNMVPGLKKNITDLDSAFHYGAALASAASDARMSGCPLPVVVNSGSGNQGITATIPVIIVSDFLQTDRLTKIRALCLSHLIAIYLTYHKGRLSALCGAFTAAIGTACAFTYLLTGGMNYIHNAINMMFANLMGIICDGAKKTCALKIFSCIEAAAMSAKLALSGQIVGSESGIISSETEKTIEYANKISHEGMLKVDKTILSIMLNKQQDFVYCNEEE